MFAKLREKLLGWKTIILNGMAGIAAGVYGLYLEFQTVDFTPVIPAKYLPWFVIGMSVVGIVLRIVTTGPVGSKGDVTPPTNVKAGD